MSSHDLTITVQPPTTLADVIARIEADESLAPVARRDLCSAVRAVAKFAGLPPAAVSIDVPKLRKTLESVQPARFRMSARRISNIRSLFVKALIRTGAPVEPLRLGASLTPEWRRLRDSLPDA